VLKHFVKRLPGARSAAHLLRKYSQPDVRNIIDRCFRNGEVFFVQIGSNDGLNNDPLYKAAHENEKWRGILIEPVPQIFERLKVNYRNQPRFIYENLAISATIGPKTFYYVDQSAKDFIPDLPEWFDQLGSFDREHILKHLDGKLEPFVRTLDVRSEPFDSLLLKHGVDHVDLIHIDAEGYDWEILSQIDFDNIQPKLVIFEHKHLSPADLAAAKGKMSNAGYRLVKCGYDICAIRKRRSPQENN
jgi:FkbM family methyltransferase